MLITAQSTNEEFGTSLLDRSKIPPEEKGSEGTQEGCGTARKLIWGLRVEPSHYVKANLSWSNSPLAEKV